MVRFHPSLGSGTLPGELMPGLSRMPSRVADLGRAHQREVMAVVRVDRSYAEDLMKVEI